MKPIVKLTLLTLLFVSVSGACMSIPSLNPFKKEVVLMSPLKGTLLKGSEPLANVDLRVEILMPDGERRPYHHKTDSNGYFDLPVITDTMTMGPMTEFAVSQWVYAALDGVDTKIWAAGKRSDKLHGEFTYEPGEFIGLTCDINDDRNDLADEEGSIVTLCKWKEIRRI